MTSFKLNHLQIQNQLNHLTKNTSFPLRVQKLYSTEHFICAEVRTPGKSLYLHFGRGSHFEGLFVWNRKPDSEFRIKDQFLEYLRKNLRGQKINSIELHPYDRIIKLHLGGSLESTMIFFWKGVKLLFTHIYKKQNDWEIFYSNRNKEIVEYAEKKVLLKKVEDELGARSEERNYEARFVANYNDYKDFYKENFLKRKIDKRKLKRQKKKIENVERDLNRLKELIQIEKYTEPDFELDLTELKEIKKSGKRILFGSLSYYQKRGVIFDKVKNYKKNITRQENLLDEMRNSLNDEKLYKVSKSAKLIRVLEKTNKKESLKKTKVDNSNQANFKEFFLETGEKIYLGLSAIGNDYIRSKIAKKSDIWVHLENYTSPHAIIRNLQGNRPSVDLMQVVGSIIRDYSEHKILEIPLQYTEVKNLKGIKGKAGSVIYKKEKYITVSYKPNWMHNITGSF